VLEAWLHWSVEQVAGGRRHKRAAITADVKLDTPPLKRRSSKRGQLHLAETPLAGFEQAMFWVWEAGRPKVHVVWS